MTEIRTLLFDLDGTLYPVSNGYVSHIRRNLFEFMYEKNFVARSESAESVWKPLFQKFNQSRRGLKHAGFEFDDDEYWAKHRSGMEMFFTIDPILRENILSFPQDKYIFTNCNELEAAKLLDLLGIGDCFQGIFGASFMGDVCKPEEQAFKLIMEKLNIENGAALCLFEDSFKNLVTASKFGIATVFVESETAGEEGVTDLDRELLNAAIPSLSEKGLYADLGLKIPRLLLLSENKLSTA